MRSAPSLEPPLWVGSRSWRRGVEGFGFRVSDFGLGVKGLGFRVCGFGFWAWSFGFGAGFGVLGFGLGFFWFRAIQGLGGNNGTEQAAINMIARMGMVHTSQEETESFSNSDMKKNG